VLKTKLYLSSDPWGPFRKIVSFLLVAEFECRLLNWPILRIDVCGSFSLILCGSITWFGDFTTRQMEAGCSSKTLQHH